MKKSYRKDPASHPGPGSYACRRDPALVSGTQTPKPEVTAYLETLWETSRHVDPKARILHQ